MSENFVGRSHTQLAQACINILSIKEILLWSSHSFAGSEYSTNNEYSTRNAKDNLFNYREMVHTLKGPSIPSRFQEYAALFLFKHAQDVECEGLPQVYLVDLWRNREHVFHAWALLQDVLIDGFRFKEYQGPQANLPYTASYYNLPSCVSALLLNQPEQYDLNSTYGRHYHVPLIAAAAKGKIEIVKLLLDNGAYVEARDSSNMTALHVSTSEGNQTLTKMLLDYGADVEARDNHLHTPLHCAKVGTARLLLSRGANIEAQNSEIQTPLHCRATDGNESMVRLLLDHGADFEARDCQLQTPLHCAKVGTARLLLHRGANIEAQNRWKQTVLHCAVFRIDECTVRLLLDQGMSMEAQNDKGETALEVAARIERETKGIMQSTRAQSVLRLLQEHSNRHADSIAQAQRREPRKIARLKRTRR